MKRCKVSERCNVVYSTRSENNLDSQTSWWLQHSMYSYTIISGQLVQDIQLLLLCSGSVFHPVVGLHTSYSHTFLCHGVQPTARWRFWGCHIPPAMVAAKRRLVLVDKEHIVFRTATFCKKGHLTKSSSIWVTIRGVLRCSGEWGVSLSICAPKPTPYRIGVQ